MAGLNYSQGFYPTGYNNPKHKIANNNFLAPVPPSGYNNMLLKPPRTAYVHVPIGKPNTNTWPEGPVTNNIDSFLNTNASTTLPAVGEQLPPREEVNKKARPYNKRLSNFQMKKIEPQYPKKEGKEVLKSKTSVGKLQDLSKLIEALKPGDYNKTALKAKYDKKVPVPNHWTETEADKQAEESAVTGTLTVKPDILQLAKTFIESSYDPEEKEWWQRHVYELNKFQVKELQKALTPEETEQKNIIIKKMEDRMADLSKTKDNISFEMDKKRAEQIRSGYASRMGGIEEKKSHNVSGVLDENDIKSYASIILKNIEYEANKVGEDEEEKITSEILNRMVRNKLSEILHKLNFSLSKKLNEFLDNTSNKITNNVLNDLKTISEKNSGLDDKEIINKSQTEFIKSVTHNIIKEIESNTDFLKTLSTNKLKKEKLVGNEDVSMENIKKFSEYLSKNLKKIGSDAVNKVNVQNLSADEQYQVFSDSIIKFIDNKIEFFIKSNYDKDLTHNDHIFIRNMSIKLIDRADKLYSDSMNEYKNETEEVRTKLSSENVNKLISKGLENLITKVIKGENIPEINIEELGENKGEKEYKGEPDYLIPLGPQSDKPRNISMTHNDYRNLLLNVQKALFDKYDNEPKPNDYLIELWENIIHEFDFDYPNYERNMPFSHYIYDGIRSAGNFGNTVPLQLYIINKNDEGFPLLQYYTIQPKLKNQIAPLFKIAEESKNNKFAFHKNTHIIDSI